MRRSSLPSCFSLIQRGSRPQLITRLIGIAFGAMAVVGCASPAHLPGRTAPADQSTGSAYALNLKGLEAVADSVAKAQLTAGLTPGMTVAVARNGAVVFARGYGQADVETNMAAGLQTVYKIGSITKQFTAAVVMRLVEEGKIKLDDPITKYLPDYPTQGHAVTVRHLLNHTSGIKGFRVMHEENRQRFRLDLTYQEMVDTFGQQPFEFKPGEKYEYNNFGYYLLGEIVGRATGEPYETYLEREVLKPLGLVNTQYGESSRVIQHRAAGYEYDKDQLINARYLSMRVGPAAGGLCASVGDLARWTHLLHAGQVVSKASLRQMTTPTLLASGDSTGYGFGLQLGELSGHQQIFHNGGANGFVSTLTHYPRTGLTVVVLTNSTKARPVEMAKALARTALGVPLRDLPVQTDVAARYSGTYTYQAGNRFRELQVFGEAGELKACFVGGKPFKLRYQGNHVFVPAGDDDDQLIFQTEGALAQRLIIRESRWKTTTATRKL